MKIIQHINGIVVDILNARDDVVIENIAIAESIPAFESKEGYNGILKYSDAGLYWDYELAPVSDEILAEEFQAMIEEVL